MLAGMSPDFAENLRLLCSYHGPIADVCRRLNINRQQFTKYLSGQSRPAQHNLQKICDFFGVEPHELLLPADRFAALIRLRPAANPMRDPVLRTIERYVDQGKRRQSELSKYCGYYFKYFYSFSTPGYVLRSLVSVYPFQGRTLYKTVEKLRRGDERRPFTFKYTGVVLPIGERIHMIDFETIMGNEISQTILYPSYLNRVSTLSGLLLGVSGSEAHQPVSARVVMEYLGRAVDLRAALRACGLFPPGSGAIQSDILEGIENRVSAAHSVLRAEPRAKPASSP